MPALVELSGRRFGRLLVIRRVPNPTGAAAMWLCQCDCGGTTHSIGQSLTRGGSRSCGCLRSEQISARLSARNRTHGMHGTPTHTVWRGIISARKSHPKYNGVTICERWQTFENFLADMGERPTGAHTIDRIDNAKGYEPGNCRWATMKEQQNNRTNNRRITFNGETLTLMQWAERTGINHTTIADRIDRGMDLERALTEPPRKSGWVTPPETREKQRQAKLRMYAARLAGS